MKIRILEVYGHEYYEDSYSNQCYHLSDTTEWENVTEDELAALILWANKENSFSYKNRKIVIVTESMFEVKKIVADYLKQAEKIKEDLAKQEEKRKARALKAEKNREKMKERRLQKQLEKKKKILEQLKKELEC